MLRVSGSVDQSHLDQPSPISAQLADPATAAAHVLSTSNTSCIELESPKCREQAANFPKKDKMQVYLYIPLVTGPNLELGGIFFLRVLKPQRGLASETWHYGLIWRRPTSCACSGCTARASSA